MSSGINPNTPGARSLARGYLDELDTVRVRVCPGRQFGDHEDVGPGPPERVIRLPGDVFLVPRKRAAALVERGIVELV
jgi:hypothetical protein